MAIREFAKRTLAPLGVGVVALAWAAPASGATQIGETFTPTIAQSNITTIQSGAVPPAPSYTVPFAGVITSWNFERATSALSPQIKLKVARPAGGNMFFIVGEDGPRVPVVGFNTYPARIAVQAGDVIGLHVGVAGHYIRAIGGGAGSAFGYHTFAGDPPQGSTMAYSGPFTGIQVDVSASVEADADNDGFGDETQDACLGVPGSELGCPPPTPEPQAGDTNAPSVTIASGPKDKTKKASATFTFNGADPTRAVASFQCSLDGAAFAPCTSPHTVRVKKGKHTFQVRAVDDSGNVGSPASDDWKRKKKRRR